MKLSKAEREEAINKLKDSTAIAKYAFYDALKKNKITDEQLLTMVEYSEIMGMLKPVISANRTGQKNRTRAANIKTEKAEKELATLRQKFEDFKNIENSEILKLGKWQQRNTSSFKGLTKDSQKEIRSKGYFNVGWEKVKKSWKIISELKVINLIDYKLKNDDINGAIDISVIESEKAQELANQTISNIREKRQHLNQLVAGTLSKYSNV